MTNNESFLDGMPGIELMGQPLDLSRPELAPIMSRYASDPPQPQLPLFRPPRMLIVTRYEGQEAALGDALDARGWSHETCAGPARSSCPLMRGESCALRESVEAAVIYVDPKESDRSLGTIPRLRCASDSSSPGVVVMEGRLDAPNRAGTVATVGEFRGADGVLAAVTALLQVDHPEAVTAEEPSGAES